MTAYLAQRLAAMALTLIGVSLLVFGMVRLIPGTVVEQLLGQAAIASPEVVAAFRRLSGAVLRLGRGQSRPNAHSSGQHKDRQAGCESGEHRR